MKTLDPGRGKELGGQKRVGGKLGGGGKKGLKGGGGMRYKITKRSQSGTMFKNQRGSRKRFGKHWGTNKKRLVEGIQVKSGKRK